MLSDIVFLPSSVLSASGFRVSFQWKRFSAIGSPENCTVVKLYANVSIETNFRRAEKNSQNCQFGLQLFDRAVILRVVVGHPLKRSNRAKQWMLISGIVAVGLLDLAYTTSINRGDLAKVSAKPPLISVIPNSVALPETSKPDQGETPETPSEPLIRSAVVPRASRPSRIAANYSSSRKNVRLPRTSVARFIEPPVSCTTVTYPFVGDEYVVKVTDDMGCLTSASAKYKGDHLIAKALLPHRPRW
jgi:hypothetical protein